jgi:hypothetical protein
MAEQQTEQAKPAKLTWPEALALEEAELLRRGRGADPKKRTGLAISGGGIRSATFALGVLEGLKERDGLHDVAYLSTVSGGGYIGSWLSAGCRRHDGWLKPGANWGDSIKHLRRYSNYLSPKVGFFSADTWSMLTIWARNTLLIQVTVVLAIAFALMWPRPLFTLFRLWPDAGNWRWVTIFLFLFGTVGIAGNQIRLTKPLNSRWRWFLTRDNWPQSLGLGAILLGAAAVSVWALDFEPFRGGLVNPLKALPIASLLALGVFVLQPVAVLIAAFIYQRLGLKPPDQVNYTQGWVQGTVVAPLMVAGFLVAAILWGETTGEAAFSSRAPDLLVLSRLDSYGSFFTTALGYWPFPLAVVFVSLVLLSISSVAWGENGKGFGASIGTALLGAVVGIVVLHALLCAVMLTLHSWAAGGHAWRAFVLGPALVAASFVLTICALVGILSRQSTEGVREWWSRLGAWLGIYATAWMVIAVAAVYSRSWIEALASSLPAAIATGGGWIATTLGGLLAGNSASTSGGETKEKSTGTKIKETLVSVAPLLFILGLLLAVAYVLDVFIELNSSQTWASVAIFKSNLPSFTNVSWAVLVGCAAILALVAWRVDINEFGLNAFYRHRLARCYLGATRFKPGERKPQNFTGFDDDDDEPLANLAGANVTGPYHIVNCALNLGGSSDLALHTRHSASFTLTPLTCGSGYEATDSDGHLSTVGFFPTADYGGRDDAPTLGQAISVSGAAASPNMGYHTSTLVAFMLTVFNLRLGWWFPSPSKKSTGRPSPLFNLFGLVSELFGGADDKSRFLMVSDGGHFENLAAYELVKRGCGTIVISDGECDPKLTFEGLGTLIRMCDVDFGVTIKLNVDDIRLAASGWSQKRHAFGKIIWNDGSEDGTLIYLKASMTGGEDTPILQYRSSHTDFPHESTGDQFYREDQFESYRRLGREVAIEALNAASAAQAAAAAAASSRSSSAAPSSSQPS